MLITVVKEYDQKRITVFAIIASNHHMLLMYVSLKMGPNV